MAILIFLSHIFLSSRSGVAETMIKAAAFGRNGKTFVLSLPTNQPQNPLEPERSKLFSHRRSLAPPIAESLHLQHDEGYVVILRPPVRPAVAGSDEMLDDLARAAGSGFGQRLPGPGIVEHLSVLIEALGKAVAHQDQ